MKAAGYGDAVIIIPWQIYQQTGDTSLIEKYFGEMDSYMDTVSEHGYDTGILAERLGIRRLLVKFMTASGWMLKAG